jgi:hypothetical protein
MINRSLFRSMQAISANELKTGGVGAIARALEQEREVGVSVRGDLRYVVMPAEEYQRLRDCELEMTLLKTRAELAAGRCIEESVDEHLARIDILAAKPA